MRELFGLSFDEACAAWTQAIDRLLPPTPTVPAEAPCRQSAFALTRNSRLKNCRRRAVQALSRIDGRRLRSVRTKQLIIEAYLTLLRENPQVADGGADRRAGGLFRALGVRTLSRPARLARGGDGLRLHAGQCAGGAARFDGDRQTRLKSHVETRGWICEQWLPLWRALNANQGDSAELKSRIRSGAPGDPQAHRADVPARARPWTSASAGRS